LCLSPDKAALLDPSCPIHLGMGCYGVLHPGGGTDPFVSSSPEFNRKIGQMTGFKSPDLWPWRTWTAAIPHSLFFILLLLLLLFVALAVTATFTAFSLATS
jgi:hypothetical protein